MDINEFQNPAYLLLLLPLALMVFWYLYRKLYRRGAAIAVSSERIMTRRPSLRVRLYPYLPVLRVLVLVLLIVALARPGKGTSESSVKSSGIDIMLALDVSDSMMGQDFQPKNRLEVAKTVIKDFISRRKTDRIGLVIFSGEAYLQCPLTIDHEILRDILEEVDFGSVEEEGTAIGEAVTLAASRMMDSRARSRVILLLTDGMNNRGSIDPETSARACGDLGIRVYTVGIGKEGRVPYPADAAFLFGKRYMVNHFDESILKSMAQLTGARFYRATSSGVLWEKIRDIDRLEKSEVEVKFFHEFSDRFQFFLILAAFIFFAEIMLRSVFFRKVP